MTSPILREDGAYFWKGMTFPSVTTVMGAALSKPALPIWAGKMSGERAVEMHNEDMAAGKHRVWGDVECKEIQWAHRNKAKSAAGRGTSIHELADRLMRGEVVSDEIVPDKLRMHFAGLRTFVREMSPKPLLLETTVFRRQGNGIIECLPYAGTLDAVVLLDGRKFLIDYKTRENRSKAKVWSENKLQLAAYRYAEFEGRLDGIERPIDEMQGAGIVSLFPGGYQFDEVQAGLDEFAAFASARALYEWHSRQPENQNRWRS